MSASPKSESDDLFDDAPAGNSLLPNGEEVAAAKEEKDADLDDLFGDDDGEDNAPHRAASSAPTTPEPAPAARDRSPSQSGTPRDPLEYPEEDYADEPVAEEVMAELVPPIKRMESVDDKLWHLKLPSFVAVEPTPYNPDGFHESATAKAESQGEDDDKKQAAAKFLLAKNTIRWKWVDGPDGKPIRKSNSRFVRWSDGSFSLQLGSDLFDVNASVAPSSDPPTTTHSDATSFPTFSSSDSSKPGTASQNRTTVNPDTLPVTYVAHSAATGRMVNVFSVQAPIAGNLSLLPTSMSSKTHMELVSHIERQHARQSKLKMLDQEQDRELMMKSEVGAEIKARMKARPVQRTGSGGNIGGGARAGRGQGKKKAYDSDDSDGYTGPGYGRRAQRPAGSVRVGRSIGVDAGDYDEDDGFVVADSDSGASGSGSGESDGDDYGGSSRRKSKKSSSKSRKRDYSPDLIEDADRLIEAASREKREQKRARREAEGGKSKSERKEKRRAEKERKRSTRDYESGSDEEVEEEAKMTDEGEMDMDMDMETEEE